MLLPVMLLAATACNNSSETAGKFNDRVIDLTNGCLSRQDVLLEATEKVDEAASRKALQELRAYTLLAADSLKLLAVPEGPEAADFLKAAQAYMENLVKTCDNEYDMYITKHCRPDSLFTENDQLFIDSLAVLINSRDSVVDFEFNRAQKKFAQKYGFNLK